MVNTIYAMRGSPRNTRLRAFATSASAPVAIEPTTRSLVSAFERDLLRNAVSTTGSAELGHLVALLPDHERPLAAILEMIDDGVFVLDAAAPFDASIRLRLAASPCR